MLKIAALSARYGDASVLQDVAMEINRGEVVTLIGRNGAGKTTLLRCIMGLHSEVSGRIELYGVDLTDIPTHLRVRSGLGFVPDDRGIYSDLTVEEHLLLPRTVGPNGWTMAQIYDSFPVLATRRKSLGTRLSGGEQQILSIARVLKMGASMLLCDEPTEGLAPRMVEQIATVFHEAKSQGITVLLVEQNVRFAATVADKHYLLAQGKIVRSLMNNELQHQENELLSYLGI